ncbi:hypothetical protein D3C79_712960 [compost metagenome]
MVLQVLEQGAFLFLAQAVVGRHRLEPRNPAVGGEVSGIRRAVTGVAGGFVHLAGVIPDRLERGFKTLAIDPGLHLNLFPLDMGGTVGLLLEHCLARFQLVTYGSDKDPLAHVLAQHPALAVALAPPFDGHLEAIAAASHDFDAGGGQQFADRIAALFAGIEIFFTQVVEGLGGWRLLRFACQGGVGGTESARHVGQLVGDALVALDAVHVLRRRIFHRQRCRRGLLGVIHVVVAVAGLAGLGVLAAHPGPHLLGQVQAPVLELLLGVDAVAYVLLIEVVGRLHLAGHLADEILRLVTVGTDSLYPGGILEVDGLLVLRIDGVFHGVAGDAEFEAAGFLKAIVQADGAREGDADAHQKQRQYRPATAGGAQEVPQFFHHALSHHFFDGSHDREAL